MLHYKKIKRFFVKIVNNGTETMQKHITVYYKTFDGIYYFTLFCVKQFLKQKKKTFLNYMRTCYAYVFKYAALITNNIESALLTDSKYELTCSVPLF